MSDSPSNALEVTVSELSNKLKRTVEDTFGHVRVRGELGRISRPASGHIYLDLKDDRAVLSGIIWKGTAGRLKHQPEEGLEVIATGKLTTYPGQSRYQIIIDNIEPAGAGALMALLEERRKKLTAEGLFEEGRKQLLPYMPRVIGVVTSPSGAVIRDILHRVADRFPVHVLVWPVRVQGETCGAEVANGIHQLNTLPEDGPIPRPDLIIVARGGGSLEDLWGFNDEAVVRAAASSQIPLISAVGHETDWTLIDYAADWRAPTPTAAAEKAVPVKAELEAFVADLAARLRGAMARLRDGWHGNLRAAARGLMKPDMLLALPRRRFDEAAGRLERGLTTNVRLGQDRYRQITGRLNVNTLAGRLMRCHERLQPVALRHHTSLERTFTHRRDLLAVLSRQIRAERLKEQVERLGGELGRAGRDLNTHFARHTVNARQRVDRNWRLLLSLSHRNVLARGFALVRGKGGKPLKAVRGLKPGAVLSIEMQDGNIAATAGAISPVGSDDAAASRQKTKSAKNPQNQGQLF